MPPISTGSDDHAVAELVRALIAQHLLHSRLDAVGVVDQPPLLLRMMRQRHEAIADQVGGGLMPGIEQEDAIVQQLLLGQPFAILSPWISRVSVPCAGSPGLARRRATSVSR